MIRMDKDHYYLSLATSVSMRSTCLRRAYGAVIVKNDEIISTGYNGSPRGCNNCVNDGICVRDKLQIPAGERYEFCRSVHAEANAIISASRRDMIGANLYLFGKDVKTNTILLPAKPCIMCARLIINAGIKEVISYDSGEEFLRTPLYSLIQQEAEMVLRKFNNK